MFVLSILFLYFFWSSTSIWRYGPKPLHYMEFLVWKIKHKKCSLQKHIWSRFDISSIHRWRRQKGVSWQGVPCKMFYHFLQQPAILKILKTLTKICSCVLLLLLLLLMVTLGTGVGVAFLLGPQNSCKIPNSQHVS